MKIIKKRKADFERLAKGLLEYETLTGDELQKVIDGKPLDMDDDPDGGSAPSLCGDS